MPSQTQLDAMMRLLYNAENEFYEGNTWSLDSYRVATVKGVLGEDGVAVYIHTAADMRTPTNHADTYVAIYRLDPAGEPMGSCEEGIVFEGSPKETGYAIEEANTLIRVLAALEEHSR